jgi:hypothetical protein
MKTKRLITILSVLFSLSAAYAQTRVLQAPMVPANTKVNISIEGFPLELDVLKPHSARSTVTYRAEGTARVEGSAIVIDLAPGFSPPAGGLVVDGSAHISAELAAALGLPSTTRLSRGIYKGMVHDPAPSDPNARHGIKSISITINFNFGK